MGTKRGPVERLTDEDIKEGVIQRFVDLRTKAKLSQIQIARDCKIPQTTVSGWENRAVRAAPSVAHIAIICARYGWNPVYLLLNEGDPTLSADQLGQSSGSLGGQALMLARVEQVIQRALQEVRDDLVRREERIGDVAVGQVVRGVSTPPGRRQRGTA